MGDQKRGIEAFERLARGSDDDGSSATRGACKKCNGMGHLTYECKNTIKVDGPRMNALTNRDPFAAEKAKLRAEIEVLKAELGGRDAKSSGNRSKGKRRSPSPSSSEYSSSSPSDTDSSDTGSSDASTEKSNRHSRKAKGKSSARSHSPRKHDSRHRRRRRHRRSRSPSNSSSRSPSPSTP
ncbi:hypothetical protein GGI23_000179 [Coemansia sp. RSA 2559]|nr:hypothetical protein GGI23_000179 [Coemansia sp. RSA 2559]KAJ2869531.1 hypothetical protein GGI22_000192 [Coemansia erecta]